MDPAAHQSIAPNRVMLIFALLLAAWLVFEFYPRKKPVPPLPPVAAESKLHAVGLADNADWEGLPELFAPWTDKLTWKDDKTIFAYWNPGYRAYTYFFEVTRSNGRYRFRALSQSESDGDEELVAESVPEGETSPTHPFVFLLHESFPFSSYPYLPPHAASAPDHPKVKVDIPVEPLAPAPHLLRKNDQGPKK